MKSKNLVRQELLRRIYGKIFPSPQVEAGLLAGIERRQQLCDAFRTAGLGVIPQSMCDEINGILSAHAEESLVLDFDEQLVRLRMALLNPVYAAVRNIQDKDSKPGTPRVVGGASVLDAGPYEIQLVYHGLLSHTDDKSPAGLEAHRLLTRLKQAAIFDDHPGIRAVLQETYDSDVLLVSRDGRHSGVTLRWSDDFIKQLRALIAPNQLVSLEPYGDGNLASCMRAQRESRVQFNCY
ncbi:MULTISPECIES: hypothetical protein [Myxococcus]|uniref:hypothetical protein n=1 Tax=Myxococcus TaxID=32 RepID=UPI0013D611DC|nr:MULTISPECIES: hypothetical protein [Myxococcus]NVJ25523.1 hypothetical protein [Myxococcus sp. AM011]